MKMSDKSHAKSGSLLPYLTAILLCLAIPTGARTSEVCGINLLSQGWDNGCLAIDAAAKAGANHLQLSHRIIENLFQIKDSTDADLVSRFCRYAHDAGISEVCVWDHCLYDTDYYPKEFKYPGTGLLDLDKPGLWEWIKADYRAMLELCPEIDGLVLTFVESGARVEEQFSDMTVPERLARLINTVSEVACGEFGKSLWLRTFAYDETEYANITACFSMVEWRKGMGLMVKDVPHDFFLHHPDNPYIGRLAHPTLVEFDACGEYNGQNVILDCLPDYYASRWSGYRSLPDVVGYVARTSRCGDDEITHTPAEINLYALQRTDEDTSISTEDIYRDFILSRYAAPSLSPSAKNRLVRRLTKALIPSRDIIEGSMYMMGLNTTHHSDFRLDDPSTYSRHCSGRWFDNPETRLGHGLDRDFHYWRDLVNNLAPVSCKTLDGKRASEIADVLSKGWIEKEECMTETYLDYVITWTDDCIRQARKGARQLRKAASLMPASDYAMLSDYYERSLMCLRLRQAAAVCWWGSRIWDRGEDYRTRSLRRKVMDAMSDMDAVMPAYRRYVKAYPKGTWDFMRDTISAKAYCDMAMRSLAGTCATDGTSSKLLVIAGRKTDPEIVRHFKAISASAGIGWEVSTVPIGDKSRLKEGWDAVILDPEFPLEDIPALKERVGSARLFLQQDWAMSVNYSKEPCIDPEFAVYGYDQMRMYEALVGKSRDAVSGYDVSLIPVGTAVQDVRATFDRDNISLDGVLLNHSIGCYLAACCWYESLSGNDVRTSAYDPGRLPAERSELAKAAAHAAAEHPYEVVDFGFRKLNKIYDESLVPPYTLPDPLTMQDGRAVGTAGQWYSERRPELLQLFEDEMYGKAPGRPEDLHFEMVSCDDGALAGTAIRKEIDICFTQGRDHYMRLLLYIPKHVKGPVPVVLGANFKGNHTVTFDTGASLPDSAQIARYRLYKEADRGSLDQRWPVGMILARGYALATFFKGDLDPEWDDSFSNGVHGLFYREGQTYPEPDEWGSISAWAWGYSRALDYLETDPDVDASKVSTVGHSRLAKTALWAAVRDERFAMAYPNNPGCAGGAISRRRYGETLETIIRHYHYWFCGNFAKYCNHEDDLPFDQHELIALMAPRPIYVASGEHDRWSDPKGEFISLTEASKVYEFLGLDGLGITEMPGPWKPQHTGRIGYHMRSGPHEITAYDWAQFLDFADKYLK